MQTLFKELLHPNKRSIAFGAVISACFLFLGIIAETLPDMWFFASAIITICILIIELFVTSNHYHIFHRKNSEILYEFEEHVTVQVAHHIFLPVILLVSSILFLFFNRQPSLYFLLVIVSFLIFSILFENIYAFYRHRFALHKETIYIYDILSGVSVFFLTNSIVNAEEYWNLDSLLIAALFALLFGLIIVLLTIRNSITKAELITATAVVVIMSTVFILLKSFDLNPLFISYVISLLYFAYNIFVNYFIERIISREEMLDFFLVIMLALTLLQFSGG